MPLAQALSSSVAARGGSRRTCFPCCSLSANSLHAFASPASHESRSFLASSVPGWHDAATRAATMSGTSERRRADIRLSTDARAGKFPLLSARGRGYQVLRRIHGVDEQNPVEQLARSAHV